MSQPMIAVNVDYDEVAGEMSLYAYSKYNQPFSFGQVGALGANPRAVPVGRWVHFEAYYEGSTTQQGRFTFWQDGERILDIPNMQTFFGLDAGFTWGSLSAAQLRRSLNAVDPSSNARREESGGGTAATVPPPRSTQAQTP